MPASYQARITWSDEQVQLGLPGQLETIDPAWTPDAVPRVDEGWSLVCRFASPPSQQGNPSLAEVAFLVEGAPEALTPGAFLKLYERDTGKYARVEILSPKPA
jgi:hypothetical protein